MTQASGRGGAARLPRSGGRGRGPVAVAAGERDLGLAALPSPLRPDDLLAGDGPWEVELGFGKGRYLLRRAAAEPAVRFLGIEVAEAYFQALVERMRRRRLVNLAALRGEATYLLSAVLAGGWARAVHVYFPDPWPKSRHARRRLFHPETIDLPLRLLVSGGTLWLATDAVRYGEAVAGLLASYPGVTVRQRDAWPDGPRTSYEAKYIAEGRPIVRLEAVVGTVAHPHPGGRAGLLAGWSSSDASEPAASRATGPQGR